MILQMIKGGIKMKIRAAIVRDADNNEIYFGKTPGECQSYCKEHNINGSNGEYIAEGDYDTESRYFEIDDYSEIDSNWIW